MNGYQQFATGFIAECTAQGLDVEQMKKAADDAIARIKTGGIGDLLSSAASVGKVPLILAAVAPPLVGAALGHGLAKATDIDPDAEVADIHHKEKMNAYQTETNRLTRLAKLQRMARSIPRSATLQP